MICFRVFILLFQVGCFLFVGSNADCIGFIAEKRQREGVMAQFTPIAAEGCVEICEDLKTCFAVNYFRLNATCQLLNRTVPESKLTKTTKCFYKAVRSPSHEMIDNDPCFKLTCLWDEICMHNTTTNLAECYPFCKNPPAIPGTLIETVEIEVGQNYTYRCRDGLLGKRDQMSTVTCLRDGNWTGTNFTCVCTTPPEKPGAISETTEVSVGQNYTYKCQNGLFEKGDPNPTITCLQDANWTSIDFICAKQNWTQDTIHVNNIQESIEISNKIGIDLLACMHQCDEKVNICLSFFYDNRTNHCILSSSFRRGLPQGYTTSNGFVYYTAPSVSCDMGYINVTLSGSYFCIKLYVNGGKFDQAMTKCESEKAKLLVATTQTQIADLVNKTADNDTVWAYIGISDAAKEGTWVSWDGSTVTPYWQTGEPSNTVAQNCAFVGYTIRRVIDMSCNETQPFICHKQLL
ncbi:hypothetical protein ACJMK2_001921 [Sinanodonta woodiana]|uniref:Uncharacterized protein n=1 Tax=Sinanodonta woodiana TaxID=1069815 RepID=A0ABD3XTP1_SINWO